MKGMDLAIVLVLSEKMMSGTMTGGNGSSDKHHGIVILPKTVMTNML
jgi:hypothetical protein